MIWIKAQTVKCAMTQMISRRVQAMSLSEINRNSAITGTHADLGACNG